MTQRLIIKKTLEKNLKFILNTMIPGDEFMPNFTQAVKIQKIIEKFGNDPFFTCLKQKQLNLNEKFFKDKFEKKFGNEILEAYFISNSVITALNKRKKKYLKNLQKENIFELLKKVRRKKKTFRK